MSSSVPIRMKMGDNVAISQEKKNEYAFVQMNAEASRALSVEPYRTSLKQPLQSYLQAGIDSARLNQVKPFLHLDLRNGKAT